MKKEDIKFRFRCGSALIMTIVLTVLLAAVGVMFVAVARMDRASTSNIADNKMLDSAAKSIIEIINKELIYDTPGVAEKAGLSPLLHPKYYDYKDYSDVNDPWLASLEPYYDGAVYRWLQISDITRYLEKSSATKESFAVRHVKVNPQSVREVILDYPTLLLNDDGELKEGIKEIKDDNKDDGKNNDEYRGQLADADGDGIADSKWIVLDNLRSSKGKPIFAAVRIIDNSAMINVNTAHTFNPDSNDSIEIDGNSKYQMQVNLKGLLKYPDTVADLHKARCGDEPDDNWDDYWNKLICASVVPDGNYLSFDLSDELELRYRYCIDSKFVSRFENIVSNTSGGFGTENFGNLYDASSNWGINNWQRRITEPNNTDADRRHLLTTYNYDRVIDPNGNPMIKINDANKMDYYNLFSKFFDDDTAAQIAVNIKDYRDNDSDVNHFFINGKTFYGFDTPCVYISEIAYREETAIPPNPNPKSYAIELHKPYDTDVNANTDWALRIDAAPPIAIDWSGGQYHVITYQDPGALLTIAGTPQNANITFAGNSTIELTRKAENGEVIVVDSVVVPANLIVPDANYCIQRDIAKHKCIRRLWSDVLTPTTLGSSNTGFSSTDPNIIQAHPANKSFTNVGEIGKVFQKGAYYKVGAPQAIIDNTIGYDDANKEPDVFFDLAHKDNQKIFNYLTAVDPMIGAAEENRIKGRININTAPAFVIAQLPWVSLRRDDYNDPNLAKAIVAYRDKTSITGGPNYSTRSDPCGFETIGQLCNVIDGTDPNFRIDYYKEKDGNEDEFPDLTPDTAADDFEERDLIFARISDLATVRSDVFTAYILVRIGIDGPQKRYIAILDRSGVEKSSDKVRIVAFQFVPEAR